MNREDSIKRLGAIARLYGQTHDPRVRLELQHLSLSALHPSGFPRSRSLLAFRPSYETGNDLNRAKVEKLISEAALRFQKTRDPQTQEEVARLTYKLVQLRYLETLEDALERCRTSDMRTKQVYRALGFLEYRASPKLPFEQFRRALNSQNEETRWQLLNDSLDKIRKAVRQEAIDREMRDETSNPLRISGTVSSVR